MRRYRKLDFPTQEVRRFLEPGPVVLVSSAWKQQRDIMTLGWHMVLEFSPSLLACCISSANHSFDLIRRSRQCVINLPTADLVDTVVGIGNTSGAELDKFAHFGLTAVPATHVAAPLIAECYASFECRLHDGSQIGKHGLFVWEVVKAHVAASPKRPRTLHYRGDGRFMLSGPEISRRRLFKPEML
ncbi:MULTISPECIES: flavin reductase family protein [Xanthomonas]|uniref:Flavin reductase family protein n=1 Tax=Xanthomonas rydalmerensis TaxID=3046274 RepID=A0ABZ0JPU5_9XANT|nr:MULTISPECIES: flavin reductase family protein [unclassified Xanthomonas]MXV06214.1 flavin reductase family protein [Xanthomonas sp. LMG 9002]WOS41844.1 flavin reductase family protein [Xanthomonas sp. DM-2023]WOS46030.1 flavin reductase family protein [Xanthomonas sp. DM-2023]WOS50208.1 flavin reductase family protein [Xanthomonas sp. DM-2023]WOS54388.1 flavin reductase family protein [Xanthomonas sp. DM-2023]